jgi:hypothetical protein
MAEAFRKRSMTAFPEKHGGEALDWLQTYDRDLRSRWDYDMTQRSHRRLHEIDGWPH